LELMTDRLKRIVFGSIGAIALSIAAGATACDKVPLLAPTGSTINLSASTRTLPINGSTGLTAFVTESSGTPVQNGTTVRFTTTLGSVNPVETQTTNGLAVANFLAGTFSGLAEIHAISGGAIGTSTASGATSANVITITIGSAAVNSLTLRATPSAVGPNGGDIQVTATVVDTNGAGVAGIPVNFSSDQGFLNPGTATTDGSGQAVTTLTTSQTTIVTGVAGTKTATVTVSSRLGPGLTITCSAAGGTGTNCAAVAQSDSSNTATVLFTVSKAGSTSNLRDVTIDFGDGSSQSLGTLAGGAATVSHTYNGPSGSTSASYTATARAVDVNGETTSTSTPVNITPRGAFTVATFTATPTAGRLVTFNVTVTGGTPQSYSWNFGDSASDNNTATTNSGSTSHVYTSTGNKTATVTVTATDGRTASSRVEFVVVP
jgi:hypothetical protein